MQLSQTACLFHRKKWQQHLTLKSLHKSETILLLDLTASKTISTKSRHASLQRCYEQKQINIIRSSRAERHYVSSDVYWHWTASLLMTSAQCDNTQHQRLQWLAVSQYQQLTHCLQTSFTYQLWKFAFCTTWHHSNGSFWTVGGPEMAGGPPGPKSGRPLSRTNSFRHLRIIIINIITVEWKSHNERVWKTHIQVASTNAMASYLSLASRSNTQRAWLFLPGTLIKS